jgi:hypothetical protein
VPVNLTGTFDVGEINRDAGNAGACARDDFGAE